MKCLRFSKKKPRIKLAVEKDAPSFRMLWTLRWEFEAETASIVLWIRHQIFHMPARHTHTHTGCLIYNLQHKNGNCKISKSFRATNYPRFYSGHFNIRISITKFNIYHRAGKLSLTWPFNLVYLVSQWDICMHFCVCREYQDICNATDFCPKFHQSPVKICSWLTFIHSSPPFCWLILRRFLHWVF